MRPITFRQITTSRGGLMFEAMSPEAFETLEFLNLNWDCGINESKMDKIYEWLTGLGHEVVIFEERQ